MFTQSIKDLLHIHERDSKAFKSAIVTGQCEEYYESVFVNFFLKSSYVTRSRVSWRVVKYKHIKTEWKQRK